MKIVESSIIGELVAQDYRTASVFKNHGIDFCCAGNRTIGEACAKENMNSGKLIENLQQAIQQDGHRAMDFNQWDLDLLVDYIEKKHHRYVEQKILEIKPYLDKICSVHGGRHPELFEINKLFAAAGGELAAHMKKEEFILFPFVRKMVKAKQSKLAIEKPRFETIQNPVQEMMEEHLHEGDKIRKIETLSGAYTPPEDACNTYRLTYALLKEFEDDLYVHIHLENNILFPKAILLEKELMTPTA